MKKEELILSLKKKGFSKKIIDAFKEVPRENFVLEKLKPRAYEDTALPIGQSQTISQPYTTATMLSLLRAKKGQKVLEIGSGCGYVLALLSNIVGKSGEVFGVEVIRELAERSATNLKKYDNIGVFNQNGTDGLEEEKPYNRILISAGIEGKIPEKILHQLKDNGILVAPVGQRYFQSLVAVQRKKNKFSVIKEIQGFVFVPFVRN